MDEKEIEKMIEVVDDTLVLIKGKHYHGRVTREDNNENTFTNIYHELYDGDDIRIKKDLISYGSSWSNTRQCGLKKTAISAISCNLFYYSDDYKKEFPLFKSKVIDIKQFDEDGDIHIIKGNYEFISEGRNLSVYRDGDFIKHYWVGGINDYAIKAIKSILDRYSSKEKEQTSDLKTIHEILPEVRNYNGGSKLARYEFRNCVLSYIDTKLGGYLLIKGAKKYFAFKFNKMFYNSAIVDIPLKDYLIEFNATKEIINDKCDYQDISPEELSKITATFI